MASEGLAAIARTQSRTMQTAGTIFPSLSQDAPAGWLTVGENVGMGPTCDAVAAALMRSPEHRENILDPSYTSVGVGVADGEDGTLYVTEDFMGTDLGTPVS